MQYTKETLANGIRLIMVPMPHLESVAVMIGVGAGSRFEDKKAQGLAHFTEHMLFKGTARRPSALAISTELESLGAYFNAFTDKEITAYYTKSASKNFPKIWDILTDIVFNSLFDPEKIKKEAGVIIEELRMYRDEPRNWVHTLYDRLLFGDHPLGWEVLGIEETLKGIEREDFLSYLKNWYRSANLVIGVAGKFGEEEVSQLVASELEEHPREEAGKPLTFLNKQSQPEVNLENRQTDQTHFALGIRAYHRAHPNREKLEVLTTILGGGASCRLFEEIREKRGLAYYVGAGWEDFADAGSIQIIAGVNNARVDEAVQATLGELQKLKDERVSEEELKKVKEMIRGSLLLGLESTNGACAYFLMQEVLEGKIETPDVKLKKVDAVTAEDVQKVAQELFVTKHLNLALIGPQKDPAPLKNLLSL